MKIVYCLPQIYHAGGIERIVISKANYFADVLGWEVTIVTTEQKGEKAYYELSSKVSLIDLGLDYESLLSESLLHRIWGKFCLQNKHRKRLKDVLIRIRPDVTISTFTNEVSILCGIKDGSKKILETHFSRHFKVIYARLTHRNIIYYWLQKAKELYDERCIIPKYDKFVVLTEEDKKDWMQVVNNVVCIPNMLTFSNPPQSDCINKKVIAVGHLDINKGFDRMILLWKDIIKKNQGWQLHIYGDGKEKDNLIKIIDTCCLKDSVFIHEPSKKIAECYGESSLSLMTSVSEGWGLVITEAMQCGVPVVCFGFKCGPRDIIINGEDGFVIDNHNDEEFINKVNFLMNNYEKRASMGKKAKLNIQRFSMDNVMNKWVKLFEEIKDEN